MNVGIFRETSRRMNSTRGTDQWNRRRWIKHFKLSSFACDFVVLGGFCGGAASCVGGSGRFVGS